MNILGLACKCISTLFALFSFAVIFVGIYRGYGTTSNNIVANYIVLITAWIILFMNEGFQVGALCIHALDSTIIERAGYIRAAKVFRLLYETQIDGIVMLDNKMKRLFIGQSFMVVLCTFTIALLTSFPRFPDVWNMGPALNYFFFQSGFVGVYITVCIFQLLPSLFAKQYPMQFLNIPGVYSVIYLALAIESIGIIQFLYAVVSFVEYICYGKRLYRSITSEGSTQLQQDNTQDSSTRCCRYETILIFVKYLLSSLLVGFAVSFLVYALSLGYSSSEWPLIAQVISLVLALVVVFYCEGLKIAIVSASSVDKNSQNAHINYGHKVVNLLCLLEKENDGVKRFLLGRQMIVVPLGFIIAQITHFGDFPQNVLDPFSYFLLVNIGLPGILTLLIFSQLAPQLLAEAHGNDFMSLPGSFILVYVALSVERLGLTSITPLILEIYSYDCCNSRQSIFHNPSDKRSPSSADNCLPSDSDQLESPIWKCIQSPTSYAETGFGVKTRSPIQNDDSNGVELGSIGYVNRRILKPTREICIEQTNRNSTGTNSTNLGVQM